MTVVAHAKWFVDRPDAYPPDWGSAADPLTLAFVAGAVVVAAGSAVASRRLRLPPLPLGMLRQHVPRVLAGSLGISLLLLAVQGRLLSPTVAVGGVVLPAAAGVVGLWFVAGVWLRGAVAALGVLIVVTAMLAGPLAVAESAVVVGIALCLRRGPDAVGVGALRIALGGSLVVVAFTEKLAAPGLTQAVLQAHPPLDGLADPAFIRIAGAAELVLGLTLLLGAAVQVVALAALAPFAATVAVFGGAELVGHLPVYGALVALAIVGSGRPGPTAAVSVLPRRPRAVLATVPSDSHTWNLVFLQLLLEEHGHEVVNLGPCTPVALVARTCRDRRADLLVVSSVNGHGHVDALDVISAVRAEPGLDGLRVVIGGKLDVHGERTDEVAQPLLDAGYDAVFPDADGIPAFAAFLGHAREPALAA